MSLSRTWPKPFSEIGCCYINKSYSSDLCTRHKTSLIASACIYMAGEGLQIPVEKSFYSYVNYEKEELKAVSSEIEAFYDFARGIIG